MKHQTPSMADTLASNGELTLKKKESKDSKSSINNIGTGIWNPLTQKYVGKGHYGKLKRDGIELCQLERNSWINGFNGTLTEEEFLNQPHIKMLCESKNTPLVVPVAEVEHNLESTIITQAKQMDEMTRALGLANSEVRHLKHEFEILKESALELQQISNKIIKHSDDVIGLDDKTPF